MCVCNRTKGCAKQLALRAYSLLDTQARLITRASGMAIIQTGVTLKRTLRGMALLDA